MAISGRGCQNRKTPALGLAPRELLAIQCASSSYRALDSNLDGEVTAAEFDTAFNRFKQQFDANRGGHVTGIELQQARAWVQGEFRKGMIKK